MVASVGGGAPPTTCYFFQSFSQNLMQMQRNVDCGAQPSEDCDTYERVSSPNSLNFSNLHNCFYEYVLILLDHCLRLKQTYIDYFSIGLNSTITKISWDCLL